MFDTFCATCPLFLSFLYAPFRYLFTLLIFSILSSCWAFLENSMEVELSDNQRTGGGETIASNDGHGGRHRQGGGRDVHQRKGGRRRCWRSWHPLMGIEADRLEGQRSRHPPAVREEAAPHLHMRDPASLEGLAVSTTTTQPSWPPLVHGTLQQHGFRSRQMVAIEALLPCPMVVMSRNFTRTSIFSLAAAGFGSADLDIALEKMYTFLHAEMCVLGQHNHQLEKPHQLRKKLQLLLSLIDAPNTVEDN